MYSIFVIAALMIMATSALSLSLTKSHFGYAIRNFFEGRIEVLYKLFDCWFCMSHWVAFVWVLVYRPEAMSLSDFCLTWFALVGASALFTSTILALRKNSIGA